MSPVQQRWFLSYSLWGFRRLNGRAEYLPESFFNINLMPVGTRSMWLLESGLMEASIGLFFSLSTLSDFSFFTTSFFSRSNMLFSLNSTSCTVFLKLRLWLPAKCYFIFSSFWNVLGLMGNSKCPFTQRFSVFWVFLVCVCIFWTDVLKIRSQKYIFVKEISV